MNPSNVQRKLAAILCADVVGYSRLMGTDEHATLGMLNECRQVFSEWITKFKGRIVNAPGDSILAEFPSVVDAVTSAVGIQKELAERNAPREDARKMLFRIGLNLGDVMVSGEDLYGDGVNISARLESLANPGGICVSGSVVDQVRQKLGYRFESMGEQDLKNIAEPILAYRVLFDPEDTAVASEMPAPDSKPSAAFPQLPAKPSIAVLAFSNMSADPDQEYFSDGLSEDIIIDLTKLSGLMVIARHSSFSYKGRNVPVSQIAQELGVRYLLEGSVRKAGNHVRITAQLLDALTGQPLWAERYDRSLDQIFAVQDEITGEIVTALDVELVRGEQTRNWRNSLKNPKARELYYQARDPWHSQTREGIEEGRRLYNQVIALEPTSPLGYVQYAWSLFLEVIVGASKDPPQALGYAFELASKALEIDQFSGEAHAILGAVHLFQKNFDLAREHGERAMALSPNSADVVHNNGIILLFTGDAGQGLTMVERAMRLCPVAPAYFHNIMGVCLRELGRYDEAVEWLRKGVALAPKMITIRFALISVYCAAERYEEARELHNEILKLQPGFSVGGYAMRLPFKHPEVNARVLEHLRLAGLVQD